MSVYYENNPNGICEDAPCCGCCGPHGDGGYDPYEVEDSWPDDPDYGREVEALCENCGDEATNSLMWGSREVWYCEDVSCVEAVESEGRRIYEEGRRR